MNTFIALIRGINVGGRNKLPMANLRSALQLAGFEYLQTYIQSGNVIFKSSTLDQTKLEDLIHEVIKSKFSIEVPVLVRTREELKAIVDRCPFAPELIDEEHLHRREEAVRSVEGEVVAFRVAGLPCMTA